LLHHNLAGRHAFIRIVYCSYISCAYLMRLVTLTLFCIGMIQFSRLRIVVSYIIKGTWLLVIIVFHQRDEFMIGGLFELLQVLKDGSFWSNIESEAVTISL
jgi:hypothetical protein